MEMHADGLPHRLVAGAVEAERNSGFIEVGIEARGSLEGPDVELVGVFERHFGLVGDRLCHGTCLGLFAGVLIAVRDPCGYDLDQKLMVQRALPVGRLATVSAGTADRERRRGHPRGKSETSACRDDPLPALRAVAP